MPSIASPGWFVFGCFLVLFGMWCWRWASRNSIDVKGAAMSAAWQGVRERRLDIPDDIKDRYNEIASEASHSKRVTKAGGMAARHLAAKIVSVLGLIGMVVGVGVAAGAIWWK